jgi:hypothetical protein
MREHEAPFLLRAYPRDPSDTRSAWQNRCGTCACGVINVHILTHPLLPDFTRPPRMCCRTWPRSVVHVPLCMSLSQAHTTLAKGFRAGWLTVDDMHTLATSPSALPPIAGGAATSTASATSPDVNRCATGHVLVCRRTHGLLHRPHWAIDHRKPAFEQKRCT